MRNLSLLTVPDWFPIICGISYACVTPIGLAIGVGVRESYNPNSAAAAIVSGVLDSISSGILLYTGLVELLAHEFIFSTTYRKAPMSKVLFALGTTITGAGIMVRLRKEPLLTSRRLSSVAGLDWALLRSLCRAGP